MTCPFCDGELPSADDSGSVLYRQVLHVLQGHVHHWVLPADLVRAVYHGEPPAGDPVKSMKRVCALNEKYLTKGWRIEWTKFGARLTKTPTDHEGDRHA